MPSSASTPRRSRRTRTPLVLVSAVAVAASVTTGATSAHWGDRASAVGLTVTSGAVELTTLDRSAANVSDDDFNGTDTTPIADLASYEVFPGDTIRVAETVRVRLVGDNVAARLTPGEPVIADGPAARWVRVTTDVYPGAATAATLPRTATPLRASDGAYTLEGPQTASYTVVRDYTFDPATPDLTGLDPQVVLSSSHSSLEQVRPARAAG